jgi:class 3 adenylate cyclase
MASELRKMLDNAEGTSDSIIALILDIRGFTPFCKEQESLNVANFLKRVYTRIIDEYFPNARFYKPTGDGLLIVMSYTPKSLRDLLAKTMDKSLSLVRDFGKLCEEDEMINFYTPDKVGIGISRGAACCISSDGTIVDYSGRVINLASRLNDLARPCGVVFDSGLGITLLPKEIQDLFLSDNVYIRGIAEDKTITVFFSKQYTIIPPSRKQPLREPQWSVVRQKNSFEHLKNIYMEGTPLYRVDIGKPLDEKQIFVDIAYTTDTGFKGVPLDTGAKGIGYSGRGIKHYVEIDLKVLVEFLEHSKVRNETLVTFEISYPIAQESA